MRRLLFLLLVFLFFSPASCPAKEFAKIAVGDLSAGDIKPTYAQDLTFILVSEISKLGKYEVYSQENVRTLAGWTAERMPLGCTDTKCLAALGQMNIAKLVSGSVGKIGQTYTVSLSLFDTRSVRAERKISEFCGSENELIRVVQKAVHNLLGVAEVAPVPAVVAKKEPKAEEGWKDPVTGMEFVFVRGGCFEMGDTFGDGLPDERPVRDVCVDDFYLGKYEVTQKEWETVMGNNPSRFKGSDHPVEQVSWNDGLQFISRLNGQSGQKYRLPTEAEWEYAARSSGKREKYAGTSQEGDLGEYAWYFINSGSQTHPIGEKQPNGLGLYDMSGNVWEWCADWYGENYYQRRPKYNPEGPSNGSDRALRGGSWFNDPGNLRVSYRYAFSPEYRAGTIGFRLGLSAR